MHRYAETENVMINLHDITSDDGDEVYARATTNVPWAKLSDDEVMIKDWTENEGIVAPLQKAKVIGDKLREDPMSGFGIYALLLNVADYMEMQ